MYTVLPDFTGFFLIFKQFIVLIFRVLCKSNGTWNKSGTQTGNISLVSLAMK